LMAVPISPGAGLTAGDPGPLFQGEDIEDFDVTAGGLRFLVAAPAEKSQESRIRVIANCDSLLESESGALRSQTPRHQILWTSTHASRSVESQAMGPLTCGLNVTLDG